jgi:hypothetical protein
MLGEIARWYQHDPAKQTMYHLQVRNARRRFAELRQRKAAESRTFAASAVHGEDARPMPLLEAHPESLAGIAAGEIITIVSGLPRSGTSLMMQILEAAGIPPFTDGKRQADESNRKGYYEHEKAASLLATPDRSWLKGAKGAAVKIVVPLLAGLPTVLRPPNSEPERLHYRLLYMEREMEEILASQRAMLERLGKPRAAGEREADIGKAYRQQERHGKAWSATHGVHAMSVSYSALVHHPDEVLPRLAEFLGLGDKLGAMSACIDPALHRARL